MLRMADTDVERDGRARMRLAVSLKTCVMLVMNSDILALGISVLNGLL